MFCEVLLSLLPVCNLLLVQVCHCTNHLAEVEARLILGQEEPIALKGTLPALCYCSSKVTACDTMQTDNDAELL